ncbi:putative pentatricopeptide repeat-containing protein, mitochondrial-like [Capsicum annuum]|nr:putative pentatricopeptide repeat-containing protein, mitochondrial-like [Capsicum annuum]
MDFFNKAKAVKLKSHLDKYLVADDDQENIRQSRNGSSRKARWIVEVVDDDVENRHLIRLKSVSGKYLTASDEPFLLGMTGRKVLQTLPEKIKDERIEWEPIRDGFQVKLRGFGGKYLRANGGTPPWRNKVTHDNPYTGSTQNWILWNVEPIDVPENESLTDYLTMVSSFSSVSDELSSLDLGSPVSVHSSFSFSPRTMTKTTCITKTSAMELFHKAKAVRLQSHHDKYLTAEEDEESVTQDRNGASKNAKWTVEFVPKTDNVIRLKSCYGKYLTASNQPFLLGMTGRKVLQTIPARLDSSIEWEPIREGQQVKLRTRYGQFLRGNGGLPPWRNSVTHDIPQRTKTQDWVLWDIHVVEILPHSNGVPAAPAVELGRSSDSFASESGSPTTGSSKSLSFSRQESSDSLVNSPPKMGDGRLIYYHMTDEFGEVEEGTEGLCITFKGNSVEDLRKRLEEETGLEDITVCTKSPLNGKLYPLRLQLPPNNANMNVIILPSSSKGDTFTLLLVLNLVSFRGMLFLLGTMLKKGLSPLKSETSKSIWGIIREINQILNSMEGHLTSIEGSLKKGEMCENIEPRIELKKVHKIMRSKEDSKKTFHEHKFEGLEEFLFKDFKVDEGLTQRRNLVKLLWVDEYFVTRGEISKSMDQKKELPPK